MARPCITRRRAVFALASAGLFLRSWPAGAADKALVVHKNPSCGCCSAWADHLRANGFTVSVIESSDMDAVKIAAGVPKDLASCHTARIGDYVIEGHVPAHALDRLLAERPVATGLAVPGMPSGSPGMNGAPEAFDVIAFTGDTRKVFGGYRGADPV